VIQPGDSLLHYRFLESLGEGGEGVVWRALDTRLGREVAVKLLPDRIAGSPEALARLEHEARVLAALNHASIVTIFAVEDAGKDRLLVMELVRGHSLEASIPDGGMPLDRILPIAIPIADALAGAHARGVCHRDLKPRNIVLAEDGRPKILDFGIAERSVPEPAVEASQAPTRTMAPAWLTGTAPYMAPELVRGEPGDQRGDLFAFGVLLYEMATGRRPFPGSTRAEVLASILRDEPLPPSALRPELPPELDRVVERCLEKDPARRFQSAAELRDALAGIGMLTTPATAIAAAAAAQAAAAATAGRLVAPAAPGASVAVLPFADMSREQDQGYFCEGVAEEIISALSRIGSLSVASRAASFRLRGASLDPREIGRRLGVRALLEGSVRKSGDRLRVTAELVDTGTGYGLWSETFDRTLEDVFAIQEGIARSIASALEVQLTHTEEEAIGRVPTRDVRAYDLYLRGRSYYFQYRRRGVELAREMFERALEVDPAYARAWAGLADVYCFLYLYIARIRENIERAETASRRALDLDPDLAEAHASWGVAMSTAGRNEEADSAFERALALDPGLFEAHYFYARHSFAAGKTEQAVRLYERAEALRPEDYQSPLLVAQIYSDLGHEVDARAAYVRGLRKARARLELQPDDTRARYMGANALVALGDREKGLAWARLAGAQEPDEPMLLYNVGCIYSMAGDIEAAIGALERAVAGGLTQRGWFEHDSNLDPLRGHPRFKALLALLG